MAVHSILPAGPVTEPARNSVPVATQREIAQEAAESIKPTRNRSIRQVAEGELLHYDDTAMQVFRLALKTPDERT